MASWEMQLISRIIREDRLAEVIERGLMESDFLTDEGRTMYSRLVSYATHHGYAGARVGVNAAATLFPNFVFCDDPSMTLDAYINGVRTTRLMIDAKAAAQRIIDSAGDDPLKAAGDGMQLLKQIIGLGYGKQDDIDYSNSLGRIIQRMEMREAGIDMSKIHWPWQEINEATGGIEPTDYIVYYGRPKSMKSWVLAHHASFIINQSKRPLIYTKEMHPDNIFMRMAACQSHLPYQEFRMGRLTSDEKHRLYALKRTLDEMHRTENIICLSGKDAPGGRDSVEWLHAKIERYQPDVVFIDGLYLMSDSGTSSKGQRDNIRVQNISRGVRQMVLDTNIPVIATVQANRQAAKHNNAELDEIAFSDSIGQDVTVAIRVINEKGSPTIALVFGGSREFELHGVRIHGVPATNFDYFCDLTEKEIAKAKEKDTSEEEGNSPAHVERTPANGAAKKPGNTAAKTKQLVNQHLKNDVQ